MRDARPGPVGRTRREQEHDDEDKELFHVFVLSFGVDNECFGLFWNADCHRCFAGKDERGLKQHENLTCYYELSAGIIIILCVISFDMDVFA